jgi:uncharacterized protein
VLRRPAIDASPLTLALDTNVWLDLIVFHDPQVVSLHEAMGAGRARVCIDAPCLSELQRVLCYPLRGVALEAGTRTALIAQALAIAVRVDAAAPRGAADAGTPLPRCRDPDDQKFLELARGCAAHALLTRDRALLELGKRAGALPFRILTPSQFALADARP